MFRRRTKRPSCFVEEQNVLQILKKNVLQGVTTACLNIFLGNGKRFAIIFIRKKKDKRDAKNFNPNTIEALSDLKTTIKEAKEQIITTML